ncbi:diacylglycerol O-acyltransferase 1 [Coemansia sp. RSA 2320]|nr:diacylglycerol O-acyltransferase 1 [Coemansia sp. RSA 2320]
MTSQALMYASRDSTSPVAASAGACAKPAVAPIDHRAEEERLSRWYFRTLLVVGIRVPATGFADEWEAYLNRVSDFLQETLTTAMVTIWATSPLLALALYVFLVVYFRSLRTLLLVYLLFCFFDPRPYDGVGRRVSLVHKLPIWAHINAYFRPTMVFEEPLDASKKYVFGSHPHGVIGYMSQLIAGTTGLGIEAHCPGLVVRRCDHACDL